jgi:hypothetical protein
MGPSKPPTKLEREWMDRVRSFGCVACWLEGNQRHCAVHHIVEGGRRLGHLFTIGLCDPGHHQGGQQFGMVSVHPWKARFEAKYGTQLELLAKLKVELGVFDAAEYST